MATENHTTPQTNAEFSADVEAGLQAIKDGLDRFFAGDWEADWRASEPMTAEELIASLMGGRA